MSILMLAIGHRTRNHVDWRSLVEELIVKIALLRISFFIHGLDIFLKKLFEFLGSLKYFAQLLSQCMLLCLYQDETRDTRSNIPLRLKEFPRVKPEGTPEGEGVYLTVYPKSSPKRIVYNFYNHQANYNLIIFIDNQSVYSPGSVL